MEWLDNYHSTWPLHENTDFLTQQLGQIITRESDATATSTIPGPDDTTEEQNEEQNDAREKERKEAHRAFGLFQSMLTGVWDANVCAPTYREACKELELKPTDPHWIVEGVKCGLKPWQVIGVEWLRRCRKEIGINPLLADDCGLGKTMQGLGGIYAEYLRLKDQPKEIREPFRPSLVVCPRMLAMNWVEDNKQLLNGALEVYMWAGRAVDAGNMVDRVHFIDGSAEELQKIISDMDPDDPRTARTIFVTSYTTGWKRGLLQNGHPVIPAKQQKEIQDRARKEQLDQIRKEQAEEDAAENSDKHMHIDMPPSVGEDQPQTGVESVSLALRLDPKFSTLLEGEQLDNYQPTCL
jgi:SNF2 family DNA or RNA helicase